MTRPIVWDRRSPGARRPGELWTPEPGPGDIALRCGNELIILSITEYPSEVRAAPRAWYHRIGNRVFCRDVQHRFRALVEILEHTPEAVFVQRHPL